MSFVSLTFLAFLLGTVVLYYLVPKRIQWVLLLIASYVFYLAGGLKTVVYLLFTTATVYFGGLALDALNRRKRDIPKEKKQALARNKRKKRLVLTLVLVLNFGLLFLLKYLDFTAALAASLLAKLGITFHPALPELLMPLGVSFFIFQSAGYAIDVYRGKYAAQRNIFRFALFTSFFPQIVQGPISRYNELGDQLFARRRFDAENIRNGVLLMLWGYFKKMVIADRAAAIVTTFFGAYDSYGGAVTIFSVGMYCINLYCDFSGGIDITRGAAELFGIRLAENFKRPLFATSLADFWRRWHITLGTWMRDYVFYSLSLSKPFAALGRFARKHIRGKAGKMVATTLATFIVYLIIGIWHGANFRYIFYGLWNGTLLAGATLLAGSFSKWKKKLHIRDDSKPWYAFSLLRTMVIVFIGRYITRAPRLMVAFGLLKRSVMPSAWQLGELVNGTLLHMGLDLIDYGIMAAGFLVLLCVELSQERHGPVRPRLAKKHAVWQCAAAAGLLFAVLFLHVNQLSVEFIYKQF